MSKEISFKKASRSDIEFLLNLRVATMTEHLVKANIVLNREQHLLRINEYFSDSYLILFQHLPIGLLKLGLKNNHLHIRQLQVLPEYQKKGIGSSVLKVVKKQAVKLELPISLNVLHHNPAQHLYQRNGFEKVGENSIELQMVCSLATCLQAI